MRSEETGEETQDEVTQGEELVVATPLVWRQTVSTAWDAVAWGLGHQGRVRDPQVGRPFSPPALPALGSCSATCLCRLRHEASPQSDAPPLSVTRPAPGADLWLSLAVSWSGRGGAMSTCLRAPEAGPKSRP